MDKGLKHDKMCQVLKAEREKHFSPGQAVLANHWDPVESDTESLAQERAYRLTDRIKYTLPQKEMTADSLQHGEDGEDEDEGEQHLQVYDSLEVGAHLRAKRNPTVSLTEYVDTQTDGREGTSGQLLSDDAYSDLRYDPNWRTNLKGAGRFNESPQVSVKEYYQVPKETSSDRLAPVMKGGYRYIVDTGPAAVVTPHTADDHSDQPYHLHPQGGQDSSPHCHNQVSKLRSPEVDLSRPSRESDNISQRGAKTKSEKYISRCPELTEKEEYKTYYQQELRHPRGGPSETQHMSTTTLSSPKVSSNNKVERLTEDIVERNKITLGRNTSKCGSYATVHALKQDTPHDVNKVHETLKETASTESREDSSDPKLRWLQKTQELKVAQISKGKKAQRKYPTPPQQQKPPIPGIGAERVDCLSSPLARPAAVIPPKPQKVTPSQPLAPTFHLNINLDASLLPLLQQKTQDAVINVASRHGHPHWTPASDVDLALSPRYILTNPGKYSQMSQKEINAQLHHQNLESSPEQWQSDLSSWDPSDEVHFQQNFPGTPTTTSSLASGSYTVLPPIGKPTTGTEAELSPGQTGDTACIHRSSSDGYLVQMEKQKQLRTRVTYKAYSLKDYKQLRSDINLRGLGPDYKAIEKTRLYSNVIREQNKKISRIPFLPAKDPEGNDKKVPRMKALEYAKTIAKPPVQPQSKQTQKHDSEGFTEHAPYLEELDMSESVSLEVLRKRHEEEKKAVAVLRKVHAAV
ncbi:jhy protein homolog isoform X3 [Larimichthys crocea]|uniref:jhy protein homolog isoform X3 n=1 Tax=Larimichthys crocea TaxID=215358 RepID=UPI000F5D65C7|nr:jhy protein homolog isoform X3 [Larimichthys crocea]